MVERSPVFGKSGVSLTTQATIRLGELQPNTTYQGALNARRAWRRELRRVFDKVDYIALPTMKSLPPHKLLFERSAIFEARVLALQNTVAVNLAGNPAIAVPIPYADRHFPVTSLQLIGPNLSEGGLTNAARLIMTKAPVSLAATAITNVSEASMRQKVNPKAIRSVTRGTYFVRLSVFGWSRLVGSSTVLGDTAALMAKGDSFDQQLNAQKALDYYLPANKMEPDNVGSSRPHRAAISPPDERRVVEERKASARQYLSPVCATCRRARPEHCRGAALSGDQLRENAAATWQARIRSLPRRESRRQWIGLLQLDPANDTAWHILGRWNRVLADVSVVKRVLAEALYGDLPGQANEEAEKCLAKAIAINPNRLMHYIELGRIYAQMGRKEEARRYINKGLAMPNTEKDDPEMKEIGRETLKKTGLILRADDSLRPSARLV